MEPRSKIKPKEIILQRAEGLIEKGCFEPVSVKTFEEVNAVLRKWAVTAPENGGYHKTDFRVVFQDGEIYEGRYDLTREDMHHADLSGHMMRHVRFMAGLWRSWMSEDDYQNLLREYEKTQPGVSEKYREFLKRYEF